MKLLKKMCFRCNAIFLGNCTEASIQGETSKRIFPMLLLRNVFQIYLSMVMKNSYLICHPFRIQITKCFFDGGYLDTRVYLLDDLAAGHVIEGPAIIIDQNRYYYVL